MLYFFLYKIKTLRLLPLRICHIFFCYNDNKRSRMKNMKRKKKVCVKLLYSEEFFKMPSPTGKLITSDMTCEVS